MSTIRFDFMPSKLIQVIAYFAWKELPKLDKLKTIKLLFFSDKEHLLTHGRPILGDVYFCLQHGPAPSFSKNIIDDFLDQWNDVEPGLKKYVKVDQSGKFPQFVSVTSPDLEALSKSEVDALEKTIEKYGQMDPWALRNLSHDELCWKIADSQRHPSSGVEMPYELFFEGQPDNVRTLLELLREEQENRDFAQELSR